MRGILVAVGMLFMAGSVDAQVTRRRPVAPAPLAIPDSAPDGLYAGTVKREYDRFRDSTGLLGFVNVGPVKSPTGSGHTITVGAAYSIAGQGPGVPKSVLFTLTTRTREWQYLKCRALVALVDGKPFELPPAQYDGSVRSGGVTETFVMKLPVPRFLAIANATTFEGKVCLDEFTVTGNDLLTLRELASRMKRTP